MTRPAPLSEADVRLRLYPSSGRVVKVTEGYWPSRDLFGCKTLVSRDATPGRPILFTAPEPLPPTSDLLAVQQWMRAGHASTAGAGRWACRATAPSCRPAPREGFTNAVCSGCGKDSPGNIDARGACAACGAPFQITARTQPRGEPDGNR